MLYNHGSSSYSRKHKLSPRVTKIEKPLMVQAAVVETAIKRCNEGVLNGLTCPNEVQLSSFLQFNLTIRNTQDFGHSE